MDVHGIYESLERRRVALGLSKTEVVRRALGKDANPSVYQNIQRAKSPRFETVEALANALGLECYLGEPRHSGTFLYDGSIDHSAGEEFSGGDTSPLMPAALVADALGLPPDAAPDALIAEARRLRDTVASAAKEMTALARHAAEIRKKLEYPPPRN